MWQKLFVEGVDDKHVVMHLSKARQLPFPQGFENFVEYERDFISAIEGTDKKKWRKAIKPILNEESAYKNIGIILDADDNLQSTWSSITAILNSVGYQNIPGTILQTGFILQRENFPKIGIWIMPNNIDSGRLEDFLKYLFAKEDKLLPIAEKITQQLMEEGLNLFSPVKKAKAEVRTWLAWQNDPGIRLGTAVSNVMDTNAPLADIFLTWLQTIFEFEPPNL